MRFGIVLLLIAVPILEVALLIKLGGVIGFWGTLLVILGTGIAGGIIIQREGFAMALRLRERLTSGQATLADDVDSVMVFMAGVLLIAPGLLTDFCGVLLLIPPVRRLLRERTGRWFSFQFSSFGDDPNDTAGMQPGGPHRGDRPAPVNDGPIIEGEFERIDERTIDPERDRRTGR